MLDRRRYDTWAYKQSQNQCVLASYAAALWPTTQQDASEYFVGYCRHFKLLLTTNSTESEYDKDFGSRSHSTPGGGFGVINILHNFSSEPAFANARAAMTLHFSSNGANDWTLIERALRTVDSATAQIFINDNPGSPLAGMHSVSVAADTSGLYAYDSNPGQVIPLPGGKSQLGLIGHAFLFVPT
jgi:hypothetical protein